MFQVPAHFSKSTIRRQDFLDVQKIMDSGANKSSTPFQKYCDTRWLVRGKVCLLKIIITVNTVCYTYLHITQLYCTGTSSNTQSENLLLVPIYNIYF